MDYNYITELSYIDGVIIAIALVLPGLTTGCPAGRQAGWLAGQQIDSAKLKKIEIIYRIKYLTFRYV